MCYPYYSISSPDATNQPSHLLHPTIFITPVTPHFTHPAVNGPRRNTQNTQFSQPNEVLASLTKAPLSGHKLGILQQPAPRYCTAQYLTEPLRRSQRMANAHRDRNDSDDPLIQDDCDFTFTE